MSTENNSLNKRITRRDGGLDRALYLVLAILFLVAGLIGKGITLAGVVSLIIGLLLLHSALYGLAKTCDVLIAGLLRVRNYADPQPAASSDPDAVSTTTQAADKR